MEKVNRAIAIRKPRSWILVLVTFATGITSGLGGMTLALLLRLVQHIAYGHGLHTIVGRVSFLQEVTAASDLRRFLALCACGAVAGIGWSLLYRFGAPLVSIRQAVQKGDRMPFWPTLIHAIPQIMTFAAAFCDMWTSEGNSQLASNACAERQHSYSRITSILQIDLSNRSTSPPSTGVAARNWAQTSSAVVVLSVTAPLGSKVSQSVCTLSQPCTRNP